MYCIIYNIHNVCNFLPFQNTTIQSIFSLPFQSLILRTISKFQVLTKSHIENTGAPISFRVLLGCSGYLNIFLIYRQGSQPGSKKNPYSRFQELIKSKFFYIGHYYDVIHATESSYFYYYISYICSMRNW